LFLAMLLPLVFHGGGKVSLDHLLLKLAGRDSYVGDRIGDGIAAAMLFGILGTTVVFIEPSWGIGCFVLATLCGLAPALRS
jgi:hypothetical protein